MNQAPKVSIIVPVYNVEKYLDECIKSILSQSFIDFELFLVDDGSTDLCPQMCDCYAKQDKRVKVIHKHNGGQAEARNFGLEAILRNHIDAENHYVAFVDSDDRLSSDALSVLLKKAIDTNADIVLGSMKRFSGGNDWRPYTRLKQESMMTGKEALVKILEGKELNISLCSAVFKIDIFRNILMPKGLICEDWYIMPDIYLKANSVLFTPHQCYEYRDNPESTMGKIIKNLNPQVIEVAKRVIFTIKAEDEQLYIQSLWSNVKRVWKYVGIIYINDRQRNEKEYLIKVRCFIKLFIKDLLKSGRMSLREKIGILSFCYFEPLCALLYRLKR